MLKAALRGLYFIEVYVASNVTKMFSNTFNEVP